MLAVSGVFFIGLLLAWALSLRLDVLPGDEYSEMLFVGGEGPRGDSRKDSPLLAVEAPGLTAEMDVEVAGDAAVGGEADPVAPVYSVVSADVCETFIRAVFQKLSRLVEIRELSLDMGAQTLSLVAGSLATGPVASGLLPSGAERRTCLLTGFDESFSCASPEQREEYIALVVDSILQPQSPESMSPSEMLRRLRPRIRDIYSSNMLSLCGQAPLSVGLVSPLGCSRFFQVSLALDYPSCSLPASAADLDKLGLSALELGRIAQENLLHDIDRSGRLLEMVYPGLYFYTADDGFHAPSMILADLVRQTKLQGQAIAAFADTSTIILTGSHDLGGLAAMAEILAEGVNTGLPLLPGALLLRDDHTWCDFVSESGGLYTPQAQLELQTAFNNIQQASVAEAYSRLRPMMAERYGQDVCIAEVVLREFAEDVLKAVVIIPDDAARLILPCTEVVEFSGQGKARQSLPLERFLAGKTDKVQPLEGISGYLILSPE